MASADVGRNRRSARPLPQPAPSPQRQMVDRRLHHRDPLRARHMASRTRRQWTRPTREALIPDPTRRLLPTPTPTRRRRHQGMEAQPHTTRVGRRVSSLHAAICRHWRHAERTAATHVSTDLSPKSPNTRNLPQQQSESLWQTVSCLLARKATNHCTRQVASEATHQHKAERKAAAREKCVDRQRMVATQL